VQELRKQFQIISELRTEIKNLQSDNLKLYEKVRYMQSYREEAGSRPLTMQLDPLPAPAGRPDDMREYSARYEEAMNPFEAFRGRVRILSVVFFVWLIMFIIGSNTGVSKPPSRGTGRTRAYASNFGQPSCTNYFHLLCACTSSPGHVHNLRMHIVIRRAAAKAAWSIWFMTYKCK
jgi:homeobox protein cut-like